MAKTDKPNILILWGDDIGIWNISHFSRGMMGYRTPNIDRIAKEGVTFTDYYSQQSCTAGRACFICGQNPIRTGLTKVGMPGANVGLQKEDPTIAELLKPLGYATGQFGKNHFGDKDEFLPTKHGFDEFFGFLYHLNACEEPELRDYPTEKDFPIPWPLPKYLFSIARVITMEFGETRAVPASPSARGIEKSCRKLESQKVI